MANSIKDLEKTISSALAVPPNHLTLGLTNLIHSNKALLSLITHRRLPTTGWSDIQIQSLLFTLSTLDTNHESTIKNSSGGEESDSKFNGRWVGVGEREGRVYSDLVMQRHWGMSHGIGRSGDVTEPQPKAVGSSILAQLTKCLVLDAMKRGSGLKGDRAGEDPAKFGIVLPMCTGMSMALVLSSLRESSANEIKIERHINDDGGDEANSSDNKFPQKDLILWSRIDQKSCFKAIFSAGLQCEVVPTTIEGDSVVTDLEKMEEYMEKYQDRLLAVITTTSCFAPRVPDKVDEVGKLCKARNVAHVINNAYGLQCPLTCKLINRACVVGRVDAIVCSTDKNFLVPVGGAIVISPIESMIKQLGKIYAGRASGAPIADLFVTLLSMGLNGYKSLLEKRNTIRSQFKERFEQVAKNHGERILDCPKNTISFGISLDSVAKYTLDEKKKGEITSLFGSMLFTRCVSGTRVVSKNQIKTIAGHEFVGFGSSTEGFPNSYLTAACAIGLSEAEMEEFFVRLEKCFKDFKAKMNKKAEKQLKSSAE